MNSATGTSSQHPKEEKRHSERVDWKFPISLFLKKLKPIHGEVKNISLNGSYVVCNDMDLLKSGDICHFKLSLSENDPKYNIEGRAEVVRTTRQRAVGLQFSKLDVPSLIHLRQIIAFNLS